ncbi:N-alpha-acetyltransferase 60 [Monomorium pharaonis]|uniref:N-alpha-acetyltransferase 60 n=1 Tax=Monomorium pharaonis TaxID=307658 RepID=UPI00063FCA08|nr:N-alpha-acetyltransferase 60 [Monomorium pharaonis]
MVVSFNRYLPVILPEIDESELGGAVAACSGVGPPDVKQRAPFTTDETVARSCSASSSITTIGSGSTTTTTTPVTTPPVTVTTSAVTVPLCVLGEVQLRFLCPDDLEEVRSLCQDWFPIDYPYSWYEDITSSSRFYALAAVYGGVIIGLIVAEIKPYARLNKEDRGILCSSLGKNCLVGYILSLGVRRAYRRNGIASLLLEQLLAHVTAPERSSVKAVFLHVLSSNAPAILFYQRCHFRLHSFLPYYYSIRGKCKDGFTYVLYVNGGHAPWGIWDWVRHLAGAMTNLVPCRVPRWIWQRLLWATTILSYHR